MGQEMDLPIVYSDASIIVVDKPSGLLTVSGRGPMNQVNLAAQVQRLFADALVVHRLDRDTSGLVVMARGCEISAAIVPAVRTAIGRETLHRDCRRGVRKRHSVESNCRFARILNARRGIASIMRSAGRPSPIGESLPATRLERDWSWCPTRVVRTNCAFI